jgi:hypothetical protein
MDLTLLPSTSMVTVKYGTMNLLKKSNEQSSTTQAQQCQRNKLMAATNQLNSLVVSGVDARPGRELVPDLDAEPHVPVRHRLVREGCSAQRATTNHAAELKRCPSR